MRTRLIVGISVAVIALVIFTVVLVSQFGSTAVTDASFDVPLQLQPLNKWSDELIVRVSEVPQGWVIDGTKTESRLGVATRVAWFTNPSARDIPWINFSERLALYSNVQEATDKYQEWINATIPPAYESSWKHVPALDFPSHAEHIKTRCLSGEVNLISHQACVSIAQYQNLIVVVRGIVYDKWLPASDFRQILEAMDRRIARVLSGQ